MEGRAGEGRGGEGRGGEGSDCISPSSLLPQHVGMRCGKQSLQDKSVLSCPHHCVAGADGVRVEAPLLSAAPRGASEEVGLCYEQRHPLLLQTSSDVLLCLSEDGAAGPGWEVVHVAPTLAGNHLRGGGRGGNGQY